MIPPAKALAHGREKEIETIRSREGGPDQGFPLQEPHCGYRAAAIKWSFVRKFNDTESCLAHLEQNGFVSVVTSPHTKGRTNVILHKADYTRYKKLAVWFGNEGIGISRLALQRSEFCVNIPMFGIIESLNLGTSSGIVLYEITRQRREFQHALRAKVAAKRRAKRAASRAG